MITYVLLSAVLGVEAVYFEQKKSPAPSGVPEFVTRFAPIVHLYSSDPYRPSDIGAQLANTQPAINYTTVSGAPDPLTLDNLNDLNNLPDADGGKEIFLTSKCDPTTDPRPQYLYGVTPSPEGKTDGAVSAAIITVDKGAGIVDAFYMYFYAFDYGGDYLDEKLNVGNHVGDWEHNMIRFNNSLPTAIWYSQHSRGEAFSYAATEKYETDRPITYSANGTHANYASSGTHDHTIPGADLPAGPVEDHTDAGPIWDPTLNAYYYSYDPAAQTLQAYGGVPVHWLYFRGAWGDKKYAKDDPRQSCPLGIDGLCKYGGGPTGPIDKDLDRKKVCPDGKDCLVRRFLST